MSRLSDFKPLAKVTLPCVGDIPCAGLTLIVGPNSSGKSQFLRDIYQRLCGEERALVVATDVQVNKPPEYKSFVSMLESEGFFETFVDQNNQPLLRPRTTYVGTGQSIPPIQVQQAEGFYNSFDPTDSKKQRGLEPFLNHFGRWLVAALFLERRLTMLNTANLINFQQQPPTHDFHVLHNDDLARPELTREISASFGRAVWTDITSGNAICLRVCDGELPSAEDRHSTKKMSQYRTIETEGDGLKSYVTICIALLLGQRPVCIIDEPEMCLHPPQAYNLGRFIGKYGSSGDTATFVATHSSQILRGVVQSSKEVEIIRMSRFQENFLAHRLSAAELVSALRKPTLRAESVLDGIFSESVVVVEADGDRLVYHTTWETMSKELMMDVHFAAVGGTGGIADICQLYRTLNIPVAVIADLDIVVDLDKIHRILHAMINKDQADALIAEARLVVDEIRKCPPTISQDEVRQRLAELGNSPMAWEKSDDIKMRRGLSALSHDLDRMRRIKSGGISKLPENIAAPLRHLAESLRRIGFFLVPVGQLEEWLATEGITISKENKAEWSNEAALKIQSKGACPGDVWDFVRGVGRYLHKRSSSLNLPE
jgi:AAA domain, putative AbiEii toxin, Type IV TA system